MRDGGAEQLTVPPLLARPEKVISQESKWNPICTRRLKRAAREH